ncbi:MAG: hypothetical protein ACFCVB_05750 [Nodosilinea sp.]
MPLETSSRRYQLDIPHGIWPDFFAQFTEDNRGRLMALKQLSSQRGEVALLHPTPLDAVVYDRLHHRSELIVTVNDPQRGESAYGHRIIDPQFVSIITDDDGVTQSCTVIDGSRTQTMISFQPSDIFLPSPIPYAATHDRFQQSSLYSPAPRA